MARHVSGLLATLILVSAVGPAASEEALVVVVDGKTFVACEFANRAIAAGFFENLEDPRITGTCPPVEITPPLEPIVGTPVVPKWPPIAPWCDCTDDEWQAIWTLMTQHDLFVNPGFEASDPKKRWAEAFSTDTTTIGSTEFWKGGAVPEFEQLSGNRFLMMK